MTTLPATAETAPEPSAPAAAPSAGQDQRLSIIESQQSELEELRQRLQQQESELAQARRASSEAQQAVERAAQESAGLRQGLQAAAVSVRRLLLAGAPEVPEELVQGATPEEVEQSYARAAAMVERIKARLQAREGGMRLPAGAPPRRAPDLASLSPQEKIALALQRGQSN